MQTADYVSALDLIPHPEGGYFRETHRSGSIPMSTRGQTDFGQCVSNEAYQSLCLTHHREHRRPDGDSRRNCLTSIIWMPTVKQKMLYLGKNLSDHVHYWQGGNSFEYHIYDPITKSLKREVLGPNVKRGEKLQVPVKGGSWKCGRLLEGPSDCSVIGEGVAPGFDFHDFEWITKIMISSIADQDKCGILFNYLHKDIANVAGKEVHDSENYYKNN